MNDQQLITKQQAHEIAEQCSDSYSFGRYSESSWRQCCVMLARRGYNPAQIEAVMRSKWTRWAGDGSKHPDKPTSKDLERFLNSYSSHSGDLTHDINCLVKGTL